METKHKTQDEIATDVAINLGSIKKFIVPSGGEVEIREQNGADDDALSNPVAAKAGNNINDFLCRIVTKTDMTPSGKFDSESILDLKIRDKYVIMFMSRIHSLGPVVKFEFEWAVGEKYKYAEDLSRYIWDYSKKIEEFPWNEDDKDYDSQRIQPYPEGKKNTMQLTLKSGKHIRLDYMNGHSEHYLLNLKEDQRTRNVELKVRNLSQQIEGEWHTVENFEFFKPSDMMQLRGLVNKLDPEFNSYSELTHPKTEEVFNYPIVGSPSFFYPTEI